MEFIKFNAADIKSVLPLLEECYGFGLDEIATELSYIISVQTVENRLDNFLLSKYSDEKGVVDAVNYAINTKDDFYIKVADGFTQQTTDIQQISEENNITVDMITALLLMSAVFNREINDLTMNEEVTEFEIESLRNTHIIRPDLLKLFLALKKNHHRSAMKICYKGELPTEIVNADNWFSSLLLDYIHQKLGEITIEEAQEELKSFYGEEKGRKSENPYLNYIIHGTYNLIQKFMPADKVTVNQCRFLKQYLEITGLISPLDKISEVNTLQSTVKSLLESKNTPVQKHIKSKQMKGLPLYQKVILP